NRNETGRRHRREFGSAAKQSEYFFSSALDKSCNVHDTAQLLIIVDEITKNLEMVKELAAIRSMKGTTTGSDLFTEHESEHRDVGYQTAGRWLSLGKVLKRIRDPRAQIQELSEKTSSQIRTAWQIWPSLLILVTAFMRKLKFPSSQLKGNILTHMPTLKEVTPSADHLHRLWGCGLTERSCAVLASALSSENCRVTELDLSMNYQLKDSGVQKLCEGLRSTHCKLEIL
ncbi:hypothetical protein NFI96_021078, partial [Prochilodus magdalenae]